MRTQVAIIGGGPSGLLLSQLLNLAGVSTVVLERKSRDYVLSRIRAGVLEWGAVEIIRAAGVGARMDREGMIHKGCFLSNNGKIFRVDFHQLCGKQVMVYGQTEVTKDLYDAQDGIGATLIHKVDDGMEVPSYHVQLVLLFSGGKQSRCIATGRAEITFSGHELCPFLVSRRLRSSACGLRDKIGD